MQIKKTLHVVVSILLLFFFVPLRAQTDKEFWFAAPDLSSAHCDNNIYLKFTTLDQGATITVDQPANPTFIPRQITIPANQTDTIYLENAKSIVECPADSIVDYGLHIVATHWIQASYELGCNNLEVFPLKGRNALGLNFMLPMQMNYQNGPGLNPAPVNSFTIIAIEDNTQVTIIPSKDIVGHPAGIAFSVTLNRGQAYSAVAVNINAADHLGGSVVFSDKPLAVSTADDSVWGPGGVCLDLLGDQLIPVSRVGEDYIIVKGLLPSNRDRIYVYATEDNTGIYLNGNASPVITLNTGEYYSTTLILPSLFVHASRPVIVSHLTGINCELADAVVPPISCTGSQSVSFYHPTNSVYYGFLVVPAGAEGSFTVGGNSGVITSGMFSAVPGTGGQWMAAQVNLTSITGSAVKVQNSTAKFIMGYFGASNSGSSYGYFTDYGPFRLDLGQDTALCPNTTLLLDAGYSQCSYHWQDGSTFQFYQVTYPGTYSVTVTDQNGCSDTVSIRITYFNSGNVTWNEPLQEHCVTDPAFPLTGGSPAGGTYTGIGVSNNLFSPATGAGNYNLIYTAIDQNGCMESAFNSVTVNFLPGVFFFGTLPDLCITSTQFTLTGGIPQGGTYSGPGVEGNNFNASLAGPGTHWITYTYTDDNGCTNAFDNFIVVHDLPEVTFDIPLDNQCVSFDMYLLTGGSPLGGTYSGPGVSGFVFNASLADVGIHKIYYTYSDLFGCTSKDSNYITVYPLPNVSWNTTYQPLCTSANSILLTGASPPGGFYSGPGVSAGAFSPAMAGAGNHTITYTYMDSHGCSKTVSKIITVFAIPIIEIYPIPDRCASAGPLTLNYGIPMGGTYSGPGVSGGVFYPSLAGEGTHIITYTYTDLNNCSSSLSTPAVVFPVPVAVADADPLILCESGTVTFSGSASGGSGNNYSYFWSGPSFTSTDPSPALSNAIPTNSGVYALVVTDENNCSSINNAQVSITVNQNPVADASVNDPEICSGESIVLFASVTGGSGGNQYHWEGPAGFVSDLQNPVIVAATEMNSGIYSLTVTDIEGCTSAIPSSVSVTVHTQPQISASPASLIVCEGDTIHLFSTPAGGSGTGYVFTWSGPGGFTSGLQSPVINGISIAQSGTFTVNLQDSYTCSAGDPAEISITVNPRPVLIATVSDDSLCTGESVSFSANASGGSNSGYVYSWTGPDGFLSSLPDPVINAMAPVNSGNYIVKLKDSNSCYAISPDTLALVVFELPIAVASTTTPGLCDGGTILLSGSGQSGTPPYSFSWTGPNTYTSSMQNPVIANAHTLQSGMYSLTITDKYGCSPVNVPSVNIQVYNNPTVDAVASPATVCSGSTFTLTAMPGGGSGTGYTYQWNGPGSFSSGTQGPIPLTGLSSTAGYYFVTLTDSHTCHGKDSVQITVNPTPLATAGNNGPICAGNALNLNSGPGNMLSYQWSGPATFSSLAQNPVRNNALVSYSGTYSVIVTNSFNCSDTATTTVVVNPLPVANAGPDQNVNYGVFVTLNGTATGCTGNCSYQWSPAGMINGAANIPNPVTVNLTSTQTYVLTVTNTLTGCSSLPDSVTIHVTGSAILTNPVANPGLICEGGSSSLFAQAAGGNLSYTYLWSPSTGLSAINVANPMASPSVTTTYFVTISDGYNQATGNVTVEVTQAPEVFAGNDTVDCGCSPITLSGSEISNVNSFYWYTSTNGVFDDPHNPHPVYTPGTIDCQNGFFWLVLTGIGNVPCGTVNDSILITVSSQTVAYAGENDTICAGESITLDSASVTNSSALEWSTSGDGTFDDITILHPVYTPGANDIAAGTVTLTLLAKNPSLECNDSASSVIITIKPLPLANAGIDVSICNGDSVQLQASGGGSYVWVPATGLSDDSISNPMAFPSVTTTYTVSVTLNGCSKTDEVIVTVRQLPALSLSPDQHICPGDSARIWASGASSWEWSTGDTTFSIWVQPPFSMFYYVTGTDNYGCSSAAQIGVIVEPLPVLTINLQDTNICRGEHVLIKVQGAAYYSWSPTEGLSNPYSSMVQAGPSHTVEYTITGSSTQGCKSTITCLVSVFEKPVLSMPDSTFLCYGDQMVINAGWNDHVNYLWQDGVTTQFYTVYEPGMYFVKIYNPGCHVYDTIEVYPCANLWVPNAFTPDGDGLNDQFLVKSTTELLEYHIYIYSRKGELVYDSDDIYSGWDGKFKNAICEPAVFTWMIYYKSRDAGPQLMKGTVTLIR